MTRVFCSIYKSSRKDEMYLYVHKSDALSKVPEALLAAFGTPRHVTDLMLSPERRLARADTAQVLEKLAAEGFYLQMPPPPEPWIMNPDNAPAWRRLSEAEREAEREAGRERAS